MWWHNPLVNKEFRQRMRTARAPMVIVFYLLCMAVLTFFLLYENVQGQFSLLLPARSEQVFLIVSLLQMVVAAYLTPAFAATAVSGERERRTLAVLLTTPMSPFGILAGKVLSSSALLALLLVVTLPLYSLVFLFGGAVPQETLAVFGFQLFTIVVIAALSVAWSTIALRSGWSTVLSYATVATMTLATGGAGYGLRYVATRFPVDEFLPRWGNWLLQLNPLWVEARLENAVTGPERSWLVFIGVYTILCAALLMVARWRLRPRGLALLNKVVGNDERMS
ncbi:MAG: ABC transporter permease [Alicyclobacillus sp.]|nr:ABC transporter permease [Alicyclobacillus sp.]